MKRHHGGLGFVCLAGLPCLLTIPAATRAEPPGKQRLMVSVQETAGIRRFGYPVSTTLVLPQAVPDAKHFRLLENDRPIPAQFRPQGDSQRGMQAVHLDFNANHLPNETRRYIVEYGPSVEPGPQPRGGMRVETGADEFRIVHSPALQFVVPRHLLGLLRAVRTPKTDYLRPDSAGLLIRSKDELPIRAGSVGPQGVPIAGRVVKAGPLASTLRFESREALGGGRSVVSVVEMDFPLFKSWVRVTWTVEDPNRDVGGLGAELNLNLQSEPTLVDFGAGTFVYAALRKGQAARLRAGSFGTGTSGPAWQTFTGPSGALTPYVTAVAGSSGPKAEGWAHAMDRERCTALAVAGFADAGQEGEIQVDASGRLQIWRQFAPKGTEVPPGPKTLTFWLHFVSMPVQVGAATSPQAMLAPLRVEVLAP
ncbi:MAG: hypothetical protein L0Z62_37640 [Gemmataceae bacterium]|nr:hypothetical protein [Gemmataceae bacterium]